MDAKYVKGMLKNPDTVPNAHMNRWLESIYMHDFKLVHVPATQHLTADALSRRPPTKDELMERLNDSDSEDEDYKIILKQKLEEEGFDIVNNPKALRNAQQTDKLHNGNQEGLIYHLKTPGTYSNGQLNRATLFKPHVDIQEIYEINTFSLNITDKAYQTINDIKTFLLREEKPAFINLNAAQRFFKLARLYVIHDDKLFRKKGILKDQSQPVEVILDKKKQQALLTQNHDELGHRGHFGTLHTIAKRFYWPRLSADVRRHIQTCHTCQVFSYVTNTSEPSVEVPTRFFQQVHIDTMYMPSGRKRYIITARDSFTQASEGKAVKHITAATAAEFIWTKLFCRYGMPQVIITDNGSEFRGAVDILCKQYKLPHI